MMLPPFEAPDEAAQVRNTSCDRGSAASDAASVELHVESFG